MSPTSYTKQLFRTLFSSAIYLISFAIPRSKKIWIFIGWRKNNIREIFSENPKYLFLHVHANHKNIRPIWIGMDKEICELLQSHGFEAYPRNSLRGIFYSLCASYTIIGAFLSQENWRLSGGSKIVQLWHGKSLKKTGQNSPYSLKRYDKFLHPNLFKSVYMFISISEFLSNFIISDFRIPKKDILVTGIPKHDALLNDSLAGAEIDLDTELNNMIENVRTKNPRRLFFYGPTFRPDGSNPLLHIDLEVLNKILKQNNDHIVISLHPKFSSKDWIPDAASLTNIYFVQGDLDKYPIMHKFDALITDYSSLAIDFLYMNKPVILFAYDLSTFKEEMGVYEELWALMPGPKVYTFDELLQALDFDETQYSDALEKARDILFTFYDGGASKRIADALL